MMTTNRELSKAAAALGRRGGRVASEAQIASARRTAASRRGERRVRLDGGLYRIVGDRIEALDYTGDGDEMVWCPTHISVGTSVVLVSASDVSPDGSRRATRPSFSLRPDTGGIGGNSDPKVLRYHGWRGTSNDVSIYAHGRRTVRGMRIVRGGDISVTVGPDLDPAEE